MQFQFETLISEGRRDTEPVSVRNLALKRGKMRVKCEARGKCLSLSSLNAVWI